MSTLPSDRLSDTRAREETYWRTIVKNAMAQSVAVDGLRRSQIEILAFHIAHAILDELAAAPSPLGEG